MGGDARSQGGGDVRHRLRGTWRGGGIFPFQEYHPTPLIAINDRKENILLKFKKNVISHHLLSDHIIPTAKVKIMAFMTVKVRAIVKVKVKLNILLKAKNVLIHHLLSDCTICTVKVKAMAVMKVLSERKAKVMCRSVSE